MNLLLYVKFDSDLRKSCTTINTFTVLSVENCARALLLFEDGHSYVYVARIPHVHRQPKFTGIDDSFVHVTTFITIIICHQFSQKLFEQVIEGWRHLVGKLVDQQVKPNWLYIYVEIQFNNVLFTGEARFCLHCIEGSKRV